MATTANITLEDLARIPDDGLRHEIDAGELLAMTRPKLIHGFVQTNLAAILREFVRQNKLGRVVTEAGFILARNPDILRGPDVAFIRAQNVDRSSVNGWAEFAPDLAIEIVSPSDTARQIDRKVHQYLHAGTRAVWIVYPDTQSIHVYEPNGIARVIEVNGTVSSPTALPGFELPVRSIFE